MNKKLTAFLIFFIPIFTFSFLSFIFGFYIGNQELIKTRPSFITNFDNEKNIDFSVFWETWRKLEEYFIDKEKIDNKKLYYGAIKGLVEAVNDPYTEFFDPTTTKELREEIAGKYQGVGMEIGIKNNVITVITPFPNSPAEKAGIKTGDQILKIDDTWTKNLSVEEAARKIRGEKGTKVTLLIYRDNFQNPKEFALIRDEIKIPTFEIKKIEENIYLIKVYQFNEILLEEFSKNINQLPKNNIKLILDLRNNPGGLLDIAKDFAGYFLKRGEIVTIESGNLTEEKVLRSSGPGIFSETKMVVLVNNGSASASEILAGALRDNRKIILIGEKTFGKGSVQTQLPLSDGSSLKVTIANWLTPNRELIDKKGIEPDIKIEITDEDYKKERDPQLEKAIEVVKGL
ncbi:MAG: S41 family peptidase [Minisyncoccia bacterium]